MQRRKLIASVGTVIAGSFGGCLASGTDDTPEGGTPSDEPPENGTPTDKSRDSETPTDEPSPGGSPTASDPPAVVDSSVETVATACKGDEEAGIEATFGSETISIDGVATVPTPCHTATIQSTAVADDRLEVRLGFEEDDGLCNQCIGALTYEATIDVESASEVDSVEVVHGTDGETFTAARRGDDPTESPPESTYGAGSDPDPDLPVYVENDHDATHDVTVTITRESGETVYDETHEVAPGSDREVYNLREADPDGVESFTITVTMDGTEKSITVETSACYGSAIVAVNEDGELYPYYSIC